MHNFEVFCDETLRCHQLEGTQKYFDDKGEDFCAAMQLGDQGATRLADVLSSGTARRLEGLDASCNSIGPPGARAIARAVAANAVLRALDLSANAIEVCRRGLLWPQRTARTRAAPLGLFKGRSSAFRLGRRGLTSCSLAPRLEIGVSDEDAASARHAELPKERRNQHRASLACLHGACSREDRAPTACSTAPRAS